MVSCPARETVYFNRNWRAGSRGCTLRRWAGFCLVAAPCRCDALHKRRGRVARGQRRRREHGWNSGLWDCGHDLRDLHRCARDLSCKNMTAAIRHVPVPVALILIMAFAVMADIALNRPPCPRQTPPGPILVLDDIQAAEHYWTISTRSGDYGLVGFGPSPYRGRSTSIEFGKVSGCVPLSIYTVAACFFGMAMLIIWASLAAFTKDEKRTS